MGLGQIIGFMALGLVAREGIQQTIEINERQRVFAQARISADNEGKPLLVVGAPKSAFNYHPCGDTTIDINPNIPTNCDFELADIRAIPYPDHSFGAVYCSHVLEHLPTVEDACQALDEMERVADHVFVVVPHKSSIIAWLVPGHHLWVTLTGDGYLIEQRGNPQIQPREKQYLISTAIL